MGRRRGKSLGWWLRCGVAALAIFVGVAVAEPVDGKGRCGTIQSRVNNAPAGGKVNLPDNCVYRETVTIKKPLTLHGGRGVEIRGSNVWTSWARNGRYWVRGKVPRFETLRRIPDPQHPYPCKGKTRRCLWPAQVFLDGRPLVQVSSRPKSGQFAVDRARRVVLANDPRGRMVEVTVRRSWIVGRSGGVTIENLTMKHAGNGASTAAINNNAHSNWTVRNNDLSWAHGINLALSRASGLSIVGNNIHHGGQLGATSNRASSVTRDNTIYSNNTEGFYPGWSAGGMKVSSASRFAFQGNRVYDNDWNGIWVDSGSRNIIISNNRVHQNFKKGIQLEISDDARIHDNAVWNNGRRVSGGGGIHVIASRNVPVYDNTLAWNRGRSIFVQNADRSHGNGTEFDKVKNVRVHNNTILVQNPGSEEGFALDWRKSYSGGNIYSPAAGNRGYNNRYWYAGPEGSRRYRFYWNGNLESLRTFNATLGEEGGEYISNASKQRIASAADIPPSPPSQ